VDIAVELWWVPKFHDPGVDVTHPIYDWKARRRWIGMNGLARTMLAAENTIEKENTRFQPDF
jgi:hypothetical protein